METNPKISIIVPHYTFTEDVLELAKQNLKSIRENTFHPYELIYIDNASSLGKDWMRKEADVYIENKVNKGNGEGWNQGLRVARGDYLVLMDNDVTEHSKDWDEYLIRYLENNPKVGIIFPLSWNKEDPDWQIRYCGFCWMMKREVFEKVGLVDSETYGIANFEDDDYWMRTIDAGYLIKVCKEAKIKHYSRATCDKVPEVQKIWLRNRERFTKKFQSRMPQLEDLT